jgi:hypothetical protein
MNARAWSAILLMAFLCGSAGAQELRVEGGNQLLRITTAAVGQEPTQVVNTLTTLRYRRQNQVSKITVSTSCPGQRFTLRARAVSVQDGSPAPAVALVNGMPATDLIRDIPVRFFIPFNRRATIEYTAGATFSQGNSDELGTDAHTITFTLVAQ